MFSTNADHREVLIKEKEYSWNRGTTVQKHLRYSHIKFPKFNGEDLRGWVYRCEQFFEYKETTEELKVKVSAVHLEGRAV